MSEIKQYPHKIYTDAGYRRGQSAGTHHFQGINRFEALGRCLSHFFESPDDFTITMSPHGGIIATCPGWVVTQVMEG